MEQEIEERKRESDWANMTAQQKKNFKKKMQKRKKKARQQEDETTQKSEDEEENDQNASNVEKPKPESKKRAAGSQDRGATLEPGVLDGDEE